jgi:hypothetical protein
MQMLPAEIVYRPYGPGPYRMSMDLVSATPQTWFEIDERYPEEMAERRRLLAADHAAVFTALPGSDAARDEALAMIVDNLTATHPGWFSRDGVTLHNHLTGEAWAEPATLDPLELAGRLVQEDLCILQPGEDGPVFTAAVLCFPSRWRLADKIGKPLAAVHGPVPLYADRLSRPVDRFIRNLKADRIVERLNWSLADDPALFQPGGKWRDTGDDAISPANVAHRVFLRVERQTLRALPDSGAVLFGIRVHVYPLSCIVASSEEATTLAEAVRALPAEIQHYKSLLVFRTVLLTWLDAMAG